MQPRFHSDKIWEQKLENAENIKGLKQFDILRQRHYEIELHPNTFVQLLAGNFLMPTVHKGGCCRPGMIFVRRKIKHQHVQIQAIRSNSPR
jgi:hypothetical protein